MSESKEFTKATLLSITSGINLCEDFGDVAGAINFLAGHDVFTHQLPRVSKELTPLLVEDYPALNIGVPKMEPEKLPDFIDFYNLEEKVKVTPYNLKTRDPIKEAEENFDGPIVPIKVEK